MTLHAASGRVPVIIVLAGVAAAVHVGKLPPAVVALQHSLGISLLQAGFLLSLVQIGGMTLGLVAGLLAESFGLRRSMLSGLALLTLLTLAGLAGAWARNADSLLALRAVESVGLLMVAVPAPSLLRRSVPPGRLTRVLGFWGAYMPFGMALALLLGPLLIQGLGWRAWWLLTALPTAVFCAAMWRWVPHDRPAGRHTGGAPAATPGGGACERPCGRPAPGWLPWPLASMHCSGWR